MNDFIEKFAEAVEVEDATSLNPETNFRTLDEWGSLSVLSLIAMFDEEFGKELTPAEIKSCQTIADLYNLTK